MNDDELETMLTDGARWAVAKGAYKDVSAVVEAAERAGLSRAVARLEPVISVKG